MNPLEIALRVERNKCRSQSDIDGIFRPIIIPILKNAIETQGVSEVEAMQTWDYVKNSGRLPMTENG